MTTRIKRDIPAAVRADVLDNADHCHYCDDHLLPREVEHEIPLSRGGTNNRGNLVAACVSCNSDKKARLVHEWRAYRQTNGLPWPPLASHPTDPQHYRDRCTTCASAYYSTAAEGDLGPAHRFVVTPYNMAVTDRGYACLYQCPAGHHWRCWRGVDRGYFSDCPCAYCWNAREDYGDAHWPASPGYTDAALVRAP